MPPTRSRRLTPKQRLARQRRDEWNAAARKRIAPPEDPELVRWDAAEVMWEYDNKPRQVRDYEKEHWTP